MSLQERAMLVSLHVSTWTGKRQDATGRTDFAKHKDVASSRVELTKHLVSRKSLQPIMTAANSARVALYSLTLPWSDGGTRILPSASYFEFVEAMGKHKTAFEDAVREFLTDYPTHIVTAAKELNTMFDLTDYPSAEQLKTQFAFSVNVWPAPDAKDFRVELGDGEVLRVREQIEEQLITAERIALHDAWDRITDRLGRLFDRLSDTEGRLHSTTVENVTDLGAILQALNIHNDPDLEQCRKDILYEFSNISAENMREDEIARLETAEKAKAIINRIESYTNGSRTSYAEGTDAACAQPPVLRDVGSEAAA